MSRFVGLVELEDTLNAAVQVRDASDVPINADALPTFRVYGGSGLLASAGGSATFRHTGNITGATNANPIVITSAAHGLSTGMRVNITGVLGNTAANGTFTITKLTADTFSVPTTGNGAYTSGGQFRVAGFYNLALACTAANGFEAGGAYTVHVSWQVSGTSYAETLCVGVA
jgi:hypothetical protein